MPTSVDGIISASVGVTSPSLVYVLVFPEQTIGGVTYRETESARFDLLNDVFLNVVLRPTGVLPTLSGVIRVAPPFVVGLVLTFYSRT